MQPIITAHQLSRRERASEQQCQEKKGQGICQVRESRINIQNNANLAGHCCCCCCCCSRCNCKRASAKSRTAAAAAAEDTVSDRCAALFWPRTAAKRTAHRAANRKQRQQVPLGLPSSPPITPFFSTMANSCNSLVNLQLQMNEMYLQDTNNIQSTIPST